MGYEPFFDIRPLTNKNLKFATRSVTRHALDSYSIRKRRKAECLFLHSCVPGEILVGSRWDLWASGGVSWLLVASGLLHDASSEQRTPDLRPG